MRPQKPSPPRRPRSLYTVQQSFITFYWTKGSDSALFEMFRERVLLSVDGQSAGKLTQGEYVSVPVQPGHHTYGYEKSAQFSEGEIKRAIAKFW